MNRIIALYKVPEDAGAFDRHYQRVHTPLCLKLPHLKGFEVSRGGVSASDSAAYHQVVVLSFDSKDDLDASLASPAGQAAIADLGNFAGAGVEILTVETTSLV